MSSRDFELICQGGCFLQKDIMFLWRNQNLLTGKKFSDSMTPDRKCPDG